MPAWTSYFLIIVMASSTASVIGVPELVRRADTVIGAVDKVGLALWVYLWAMIWFLGFSLLLTFGMNRLSGYLRRRAHRPETETTDLTGESAAMRAHHARRRQSPGTVADRPL